jgi:hypothetical protein
MKRIPNLLWWIAGLLAAATALNYLDRQNLPVVISELQKTIPIRDRQLSFSDIRWIPSSVFRQANSPRSQCRKHWSARWFWRGWRMDGRTGSPPAKE